MTTAVDKKRMKQLEKALQAAKEAFPDVDVDITEIKLPLVSASDLLREAISVIRYFDSRVEHNTEGWYEEICRNCNQKFGFNYYLTTVKCCSIECADAVLRSMGLSWDPSAPLERRWGRYVPAIVPSLPYEVINEQAPPPKEKKAEPDVDDLIKNLML